MVQTQILLSQRSNRGTFTRIQSTAPISKHFLQGPQVSDRNFISYCIHSRTGCAAFLRCRIHFQRPYASDIKEISLSDCFSNSLDAASLRAIHTAASNGTRADSVRERRQRSM